MPSTLPKYVPIREERDISSRSSVESLALDNEEKQNLVNHVVGTKSALQARRAKLWSKGSVHYSVAGVLSLINVVVLIALVSHCNGMRPTPRPAWLPPQVARKSLFEFQTLYGRPLNNESEAAWNALMPNGHGFVIIKNETALPDQAGLNQSLVEQKAMVSVFHQLHCIYMIREGYYSALEGNVDQVNPAHLMHCFDYIRQTVMCFGDTTLEWIPAPPNDKGSSGWGYEHTCRDFDLISRWAEENQLKPSEGIH